MRLTSRGVALAAVAVLLLAGGQWGGYPFLRALGGLAVGAVLAAIAVTARRVRVEVTREVYPDRVERDQPALVKLTATAAGGRQSGFFATDRAGSYTRTVRFPALRPGFGTTLHYELPTSARGRLTVGPLSLHRADPFGLARNRVAAGATATLLVHPRRYPARALAGGYPRHHHEGVITDDSLRGSSDLRDVREYQPGDEVRHLHWKATARTGRLMVRDYADPEQPRFTLLLDTRRAVLTPEEFEEAVDLAASLLAAAGQAGQHTRLVTAGGLDRPTAGGTLAVRLLLDELCELRQSEVDSGLVPAALSGGRTRGGNLTVVTAGAAAPAVAELRSRYHRVFVLDLGADAAAPAAPAASTTGVRIVRAPGAAEIVRRWNEIAR